MGSVKDLRIMKEPLAGRAGEGRFVFSDRYSVFDWGEMPDHIINKGKALCLTGAYFFEKLEETGIKTHYAGLVENNMVKRLADLNGAVDTMQVKLLRVIKPAMQGASYDYTDYQQEIANVLIPLEIIYRNALPKGSSVFRRLKEGSITPEALGLAKMPLPGQKLDKPILDVSTKLEATDRYITWEEAQDLAGLADDEMEKIKSTTLSINQLITNEAGKLGLVHEDGKVEFGFDDDRNLLLVDVLGTPDECRFTFQDIPVSKEVARIFYRSTAWYEEVEAAKKEDRVRWKQHVSAPPPLPERLAELISLLYMAFCNELTGRSWFEVPDLKDILHELKAGLAL
jgi:phosphoribosylaminoimidazole-succinocarboxamide synthase